MTHADLIVIGASAAGLKCAARFRRLVPDASILVIDAAHDISVGACGLPYVISGDIDDPDALRQTPFDVLRDESFFKTYKDIEVRTGLRADRIDTKERIVTIVSQDGSEQAFSYGELMLALGASPKLPPAFPPLSDRLRVIKTMDDARSIRGLLEKGQIDSVGIIGAGFIGCEMAEAFGSMWGCSVTLFDSADQILPGMLDPDMATIVQSELCSKSVDVRLGATITRVVQNDAVVIELSNGFSSKVDLAVVAVGVAPRIELALNAGIAIGELGGIVVNEHMQTSVPHVYAAGDCVECKSVVTGNPTLAPLGSLANRQGRVAADHMAGRSSKFSSVARSVIVKVFDLNASSTGMSKVEAEKAGIDVRCAWGTFGDRAHYYPEERHLFLKMVVERGTCRLVGLQVLGRGEVARLVDVFGSVLMRRGTAQDLLELEFAYAPPFAAALDPLHHLAAIVLAQEQDGIEGVGPLEDLGEATVMDIRTYDEVRAASCPEQVMVVPMAEVREKARELPEGDLIVVCEKGPRSYEVARWLRGLRGGSVRYLAGGRSFRQGDLG